jgi:hypothetical protein
MRFCFHLHGLRGAAWVMALAAMLCGRLSASDYPTIAPGELMRAASQNELEAAAHLPRYMFLTRKQTTHYSSLKLYVQTKDAVAGRVIAYNDQPLTSQQRQDEDARIGRFLKNPDEMRAKQKEERDNRDRINKILKALPDAFLYEYDGFEPGTGNYGRKGSELLRLRFRPNPAYDPPSRIEQVLTGMTGTALVEVNKRRIARLEGTLIQDVSFGWGFLGHLDKGGSIILEQSNVASDTWIMSRISIRLSGKILLVKSIRYNQTESSTDFQKVPEDLTFEQGVALLKKQEEKLLAENRIASLGK